MIDHERMSDSQRAQLAKVGLVPDYKQRPSKYHNERTAYDGVTYDSRAEAKHAAMLDVDPAVRWWLRQVCVRLGPDCKTWVDFLVCSTGGEVRAHEVKGKETRDFARVRRLWPKYAPFNLWIITSKGVEVIEGCSDISGRSDASSDAEKG